jgi:predicted metal-dependent hydrolase
MCAEEQSLRQDARLQVALDRFNHEDWYECHDLFEELWHETQGPCRPVLQGILQIAVAHLHLERGNIHGATVLLGEGIGRLADAESDSLGLDILTLKTLAKDRLQRLQQALPLDPCPPLRLTPVSAQPAVN